MGRKQSRAWKYIHLYVASLTFSFLFLLSCATLKGNDILLCSQMLLSKRNYEGALEENKKILFRYPDRPPGDEAFFNIGLMELPPVVVQSIIRIFDAMIFCKTCKLIGC